MKLKNGYRLRPLGNEFILTAENAQKVDFNRLMSLNGTAAYLWRSVDGKDFDAETLADLLTAQYEVSREIALADSEKIIAKWKEAGLVED